MALRSAGWRTVAPTVATALVGSAVAVVVNLATEWKTNWWAWLAVVVLTVLSGGVSVLLYRQQAYTQPPPGGGGVSVGGNVDIHAEQGSTAALQTRDVSVVGPPRDPPLPGQQSG